MSLERIAELSEQLDRAETWTHISLVERNVSHVSPAILDYAGDVNTAVSRFSRGGLRMEMIHRRVWSWWKPQTWFRNAWEVTVHYRYDGPLDTHLTDATV